MSEVAAFTGALYPANNGVWSKFSDVTSKSGLATLAFTGNYFGFIIGLPVCGVLTHSVTWSSPFYLYGFLGIAWFGVYSAFLTLFSSRMVRETPPKSLKIASNIPWKGFIMSKVSQTMLYFLKIFCPKELRPFGASFYCTHQMTGPFTS